MSVTNALAGLAVRDLEAAIDWYAALFDRGPDTRPMPNCAEWELPGGAWVQLFADAPRAGHSSVTLVGNGLGGRLADLRRKGIEIGASSDGDIVRTAIVADPDGNRLAFAEGVDRATRSASAAPSRRAKRCSQGPGTSPIGSPVAVEVVTLFVDDLTRAARFYKGVFDHEVVYEDEVACGIGLDNLMINLLDAAEAGELIAPRSVAGHDAGSRLLLTILVRDVDAVCEALRRHGIEVLNGPIDRPWGRRTAAFADPDGNVWEVAQELDNTR